MTWNSSRDAPPPPSRIRMWKDDAWIAIAGPLLVFAGHSLYGAMLPQTALVLSMVAAIMLGACLVRTRLRNDLQRLDGLALPTVLFVLAIMVSLWSLTPWVPGGPHPVWAYLKISPGASTIDKGATLVEIIKLLGLGCIFLVGAITGASDTRSRLAINALLTLGAFLGAWGLLTFVTGNQPTGGNRMEASFQSANTAGTIFAAVSVLALGQLISRLNGVPGKRLIGVSIYSAVGLLTLVCLFATASRGAFVAACAGVIVFGLLMVFGGRLRWSRAALSGAAAALLLLILLGVAGELLLDRLLGSSEEFAGRAAIFQVHWQAFLDSPLFGYGLGTFDTVNRMLLNAEVFPKIWSVRAAHNVYLAWLEQAGLVGALPMFGSIAAVMITTTRRTFRRSRMTFLLFGLLAVDVVYLVHGGTDFALEMFSVAAMWSLILGLQFGLSQGSSNR